MTIFESFSISALALSVLNFLFMLPSFLAHKHHKKLRNEMKRRAAEEDRIYQLKMKESNVPTAPVFMHSPDYVIRETK